mmetsp:Transcript_123260/g.299417  ORF Transcript_123260/g.299417 Transcript_123260/m.299417 type:complete len:211 (-) Transcript_123260:15-647(-)
MRAKLRRTCGARAAWPPCSRCRTPTRSSASPSASRTVGRSGEPSCGRCDRTRHRPTPRSLSASWRPTRCSAILLAVRRSKAAFWKSPLRAGSTAGLAASLHRRLQLSCGHGMGQSAPSTSTDSAIPQGSRRPGTPPLPAEALGASPPPGAARRARGRAGARETPRPLWSAPRGASALGRLPGTACPEPAMTWTCLSGKRHCHALSRLDPQ